MVHHGRGGLAEARLPNSVTVGNSCAPSASGDEPARGRSALLARVLAEAVDRAIDEQYAEGYRRQPVTREEDAVTEAAAREGLADVRADERAHGRTWRRRAAR